MTSQPFAIPSRKYLNHLALAWFGNRWWLLAVPLVAVCAWAMFDFRAIYVGLALLFLIYPMALTLVWFDYALSPQSIRAITPKRVTVFSEGLKIDFLPKSEESQPLPSVLIPWSDISSAELSSDEVFLKFSSRLDDYLTLPKDAFSIEAWASILSHVSDKFPSLEI